MPTFNRYYYEPLAAEDAIRHIVLDPAPTPETPLSCSIIQHRRSVQAASYCAISYVWGKREFSRNLEIRDDGDTSYLRITANVDDLLRRFWSPNEPCHLWIDALCLDQDNETEMAQQIPAMGRIYQEAKEVCIWLGPEDNMIQRIFKFFRKVSRIPHLRQSDLCGPRQWDMAGRVARLMRRHIRNDGSSGVRYLSDFFDRPWFSRRWVIQEACLARQALVHCGRHSIPLSVVVSAATHVQVLDMSSYSIKMAANLRRPTMNIDLLELLWDFHEAACLEHKDRVAALFGLLHDDNRFHLDYTVHWTELYKQVALFALSHGSRDSKLQLLLHLFEFGPVCQPEDVSYPSWVPNWSNIRQRRLPYHSRIRTTDTYETYPSSPGDFVKTSLTFCNDDLRIHWHPAVSGPQGRRVIYATKFKHALQDESRKTKRVLRVLHELFPSTSDSSFHIFALAVLVEMIVEFRHSSLDQGLNNTTFSRYIRDISTAFHKSSSIETLVALGKLDSLLQEFCLCELEPLDSENNTSRAFGLGPAEIQVGYVMIPLWQPGCERGRQRCPLGKDGEASHFRTMLAVRPEGEQPLQFEASQSERKPQGQRGRIIGPTVYVLSRSAFDDELNNDLDVEKQYFISLV